MNNHTTLSTAKRQYLPTWDELGDAFVNANGNSYGYSFVFLQHKIFNVVQMHTPRGYMRCVVVLTGCDLRSMFRYTLK